MQQLLKRKTYTPGDASQVPCSVALSLNRDENLSEQSLKTFDNNLDGNPVQHTERPIKTFVYVLSRGGNPLMPCTYAKSKRMVKSGKAKIIKRLPITIQLNFECDDKVQPVTLGIDSGAKFIGVSAISEKEELISGEVKIDDRMSKRLADRKMYRRNKRGRLWYRKPRFNNRSNNKKENWLPPSIERRYQTHLSIISRIKRFLPISDVVIEVGSFDIQKLNDPMIQGVDYQQGIMYQYKNRVTYLLARERGKCQYCGKTYKKGDPWRLHHIWGKQKDRPEDWALLHKNCHIRLHELKEEDILRKKKSKSYKDSTFMNIIKGRFAQDIDCRLVFGYETFVERCSLGIEKSHINDAFVIAGGGEQNRTMPFEIIQHRKNNRSLQKSRKGFIPSIRRQRYPIQPNDLVKIDGKWCKTKGVHCRGKRIMIDKKSVNIKKVENIFHTGTLNWMATYFSTDNSAQHSMVSLL